MYAAQLVPSVIARPGEAACTGARRQ